MIEGHCQKVPRASHQLDVACSASHPSSRQHHLQYPDIQDSPHFDHCFCWAQVYPPASIHFQREAWPGHCLQRARRAWRAITSTGAVHSTESLAHIRSYLEAECLHSTCHTFACSTLTSRALRISTTVAAGRMCILLEEQCHCREVALAQANGRALEWEQGKAMALACYSGLGSGCKTLRSSHPTSSPSTCPTWPGRRMSRRSRGAQRRRT